MGRKLARASLMKCLYMMEVTQDFSQNQLDLFFENQELKADEIEYVKKCYDIFLTQKENIDDLILQFLEGWSITRLAKIDLSILRIAVCEMRFIKDVPIEVTINEAINISKQYSTEDSYRFINGVLGGIAKRLQEDSLME
ncbi:MAG: transcription antitermination factor NusB [Tissierellia bacterium]|nr:transcription antitermination factor NusB [Tissierellia bacterium]